MKRAFKQCWSTNIPEFLFDSKFINNFPYRVTLQVTFQTTNLRKAYKTISYRTEIFYSLQSFWVLMKCYLTWTNKWYCPCIWTAIFINANIANHYNMDYAQPTGEHRIYAKTCTCTNSSFGFFSSLFLIIVLCSSIWLTQLILL